MGKIQQGEFWFLLFPWHKQRYRGHVTAQWGHTSKDVQNKSGHLYRLQTGTGGSPIKLLFVTQLALLHSHLPRCMSRCGSPEWLSCFLSNSLTVTHKQLLPAPTRPYQGEDAGEVCHYSYPSPSLLLKSPHLHSCLPWLSAHSKAQRSITLPTSPPHWKSHQDPNPKLPASLPAAPTFPWWAVVSLWAVSYPRAAASHQGLPSTE